MDKPTFVLKSTSDVFNERQSSVFDQLNTLEKQHSSKELNESMEVDKESRKKKHSSNKHRSSFKQFKGKDSIFKRPQEPLTRHYMRRMPDHKKNPHKWTKYTLDDVTDEDMSDKSNTKAALSFLNDLKKRNMEPEEKFDVNTASEKIVFKKLNYKSQPEDKEEETVSFASSKVIMPEYVIGQKALKTRRNKSLSSGSKEKSTGLHLNHLFEEEDE